MPDPVLEWLNAIDARLDEGRRLRHLSWWWWGIGVVLMGASVAVAWHVVIMWLWLLMWGGGCGALFYSAVLTRRELNLLKTMPLVPGMEEGHDA